MPVYEYECEICGDTFELARSIDEEEPEVKCPKRGAVDTHQVYSFLVKTPSSGGGSCSPAPTKFG
jgi:putative FmdB family regulatory protein